MTPDEKMRRVLELAAQAMEQGELPIAAAIYRGDEELACAWTTERRDRRFAVHAELAAILEMDRLCLPVGERKKLVLYTNLEPCMMCLGAAMTCYVGGIVYALEAPADGAAAFASRRFAAAPGEEMPSYALPELTAGVLRRESGELFRRFAQRYPESPMAAFARSLVPRK